MTMLKITAAVAALFAASCLSCGNQSPAKQGDDKQPQAEPVAEVDIDEEGSTAYIDWEKSFTDFAQAEKLLVDWGCVKTPFFIDFTKMYY